MSFVTGCSPPRGPRRNPRLAASRKVVRAWPSYPMRKCFVAYSNTAYSFKKGRTECTSQKNSHGKMSFTKYKKGSAADYRVENVHEYKPTLTARAGPTTKRIITQTHKDYRLSFLPLGNNHAPAPPPRPHSLSHIMHHRIKKHRTIQNRRLFTLSATRLAPKPVRPFKNRSLDLVARFLIRASSVNVVIPATGARPRVHVRTHEGSLLAEMPAGSASIHLNTIALQTDY